MSPKKSDSLGWHFTSSLGLIWEGEAKCVPCSQCYLINRAVWMWVSKDRPAGLTLQAGRKSALPRW